MSSGQGQSSGEPKSVMESLKVKTADSPAMNSHSKSLMIWFNSVLRLDIAKVQMFVTLLQLLSNSITMHNVSQQNPENF